VSVVKTQYKELIYSSGAYGTFSSKYVLAHELSVSIPNTIQKHANKCIININVIEKLYMNFRRYKMLILPCEIFNL
jgi:hypothetical protein